MIFQKLKKLFEGDYQTLNLITISREKLLTNYSYLSGLDKNLQIAPVLKSNAYGHGLELVGRILDQVSTPPQSGKHPWGAPFFCVDSLYEAYELQKINIKTPILIMGYTDPENFKVKALPFQYAVFDLHTVEVLNKYQPGAKIHIFVDTGMNREGVKMDELDHFLTQIKQFKNLEIVGVMSHLAFLSDSQVDNFKLVLDIFQKHNLNPQWRHLGASSAITDSDFRAKIAKVSNLARVGLAMYASVLQLRSKLIQIKTVKKGEKIGYDSTFTATKDVEIGILPIGYNDGVDRRLSNAGFVTINDEACKILGRVSMNITTIDLTNAPKAQIGDIAIFDLEKSAQICQTIPYELLVHLHPSIKKVII